MSDPTFAIPPPVTGQSGISATDAEDAQAKFYGEDIWYNLAAADPLTGKADYVVLASGDWAVATGLIALRQSLLRRLITNPGEWQTMPQYGVGALQFVKRPNTAAVRAELEARIRSQFLRDDRVESITKVQIDPLPDGEPGLVVTVFIVAAGRLRQDAPLPMQFEIR